MFRLELKKKKKSPLFQNDEPVVFVSLAIGVAGEKPLHAALFEVIPDQPQKFGEFFSSS